MITRKTAQAIGPSIGLGALKKAQRPPTLPHECKRRHRWNGSLYSRRCSRCGREEEKNPATQNWECLVNAQPNGGAEKL